MTLADSNFDALHQFRGLTQDEKMESLFMGQRENLVESKVIGLRLDALNGQTKKTADTLTAHLGDHGQQQAGIDFIRRWGARGTGLILIGLALLGGANAIAQIIEAFRN